MNSVVPASRQMPDKIHSPHTKQQYRLNPLIRIGYPSPQFIRVSLLNSYEFK
jgi:hypothetical protein